MGTAASALREAEERERAAELRRFVFTPCAEAEERERAAELRRERQRREEAEERARQRAEDARRERQRQARLARARLDRARLARARVEERCQEDARAREQAARHRAAAAERQRVAERKRAERKRAAQRELASSERALAGGRRQMDAVKAELEILKQRGVVHTAESKRLSAALDAGRCEHKEKERAVKCESARIREMHVDSSSVGALRLVLYGQTGDGKSLSGNRLCGDRSERGSEGPFDPSDSVASVTSLIRTHGCELLGHSVLVMDQPGTGDSRMRDTQFAEEMMACLRGVGSLRTVVIVRSAARKRVTEDFFDSLRSLQSMLGKGVWNNAVLLLTHVSDPSDSDFVAWRKEFQRVLCAELAFAKCPPVLAVDNMHVANASTIYCTLIRIAAAMDEFTCDALVGPLDEMQASAQRAAAACRKLQADHSAEELSLQFVTADIAQKRKTLAEITQKVKKDQEKVHALKLKC